MNSFTHLIGRKPFVIGGVADPYLRRWWLLPRNPWMNIYLHHFLRSDDDRALHDHPWWNASILLRGQYLEHREDGSAIRRAAPCFAVRQAADAHRIELIENRPVWTLFITGPKVREWGFLCPKGWRHWTVFCNAADDGATIGKGCE